MKKIRFWSDDTTWRIELNDPPLNILDIEMLEELRQALGEVRDDRCALVISGAGEKAFSAGASVQDHLGDRVERMLSAFHGCFRLLHRFEMPTISLVKGLALGGGSELALGCDLVLASTKAKFGQPEIVLGVFPPVAAWQLSRQAPPRRGLELLLTGDPVDAATAQALGMTNAVFEPAEFDSRAEEWIARLTRHSPSSVRMTKKAYRMAGKDDFEERLGQVERFYLDELMKTEDAVEGLTAFTEKRKPVWKGR